MTVIADRRAGTVTVDGMGEMDATVARELLDSLVFACWAVGSVDGDALRQMAADADEPYPVEG